ncbi:MAG: DNA-3-methyladenine glycosylase [Solirubrobacteraceae bacterium]
MGTSDSLPRRRAPSCTESASRVESASRTESASRAESPSCAESASRAESPSCADSLGGRPPLDAPLPRSFYARPVLDVARELIGCIVSHRGASGVIVEAEAYHHSEPACHAFAGVTPRTRTLFGAPGRAYVYRSYGIHALLNAVCEGEGVGAAVLIRALRPLTGIEAMRSRRRGLPLRELCSGPGKLSAALAIELGENGSDLCGGGPICIVPPPAGALEPAVLAGARVGITKAVELPWRFCVAGSEHVSRPRPRIATSRGSES